MEGIWNGNGGIWNGQGVKRTRWIAARHKLLGVWGLYDFLRFYWAANTRFCLSFAVLFAVFDGRSVFCCAAERVVEGEEV